ncbi:MAG: tRNA (adenosine(37)-N6)-dimethylallyltransferase MiaA [Halobacteriovoraceae bacterium]|jgi:tRNA dimethylallyltransferase|nr:tRNA (adenosine(37)-N6)-dimethylallyltransferase MiaA [Halobacteriovoraceae bacterium]
MPNKIIIISGPTASGKTSTSINLAKLFDGEVVNFDSLLFYKEINIGTAKPTREEQGNIPHHLIDTHSIFAPINAAGFIQEAIPVINDCHQREKVVFLVGGSGFYLQAVINGMYESVSSSKEVLERSDILYQNEGIGPFREILKNEDPDSYTKYNENDHYRNRRAVEHFWMTGERFSKSRSEMGKKGQESPSNKYQWDILHLYLDIPKEEHFPIIQARTEQMFSQGILTEVKNLLESGANGSEKPLNSIGYKEVIAYLHGEFSSLAECKERISINTRRLAKSQRTWFNKQDKTCYNSMTDLAAIESTCRSFLK